MSGVTIYDLPQEVLDRIIKCIPWQDTKTLKACALTHRAWTPTSQQQLHERQHYSWQFGGYLPDTFRYSSSRIAAMVRSLTLFAPPSPAEDPDAWTLLSRFSRVTELIIEVTDWYCTVRDRERLHTAFGQVTHLTLDACTWHHGHDFVYFLSAFPNVVQLEIKDPMMIPKQHVDFASCPRQAVDTIPGTALRKLTITWNTLWGELDELNLSEFVGPWLSHFPSVVPAGLHFRWESSCGWLSLPEYVRAVGPVLGDLEVSCISDEPAPRDFGLNTCTQLRTLSIGSICAPPLWDGPVQEYAWIPQILAEISSPNIHAIHLGFDSTALRDLERVDFAHIDALLSDARFAGAKIVLSFSNWALSSSVRSSEGHLATAVKGMVKSRERGRLLIVSNDMALAQAVPSP